MNIVLKLRELSYEQLSNCLESSSLFKLDLHSHPKVQPMALSSQNRDEFV